MTEDEFGDVPQYGESVDGELAKQLRDAVDGIKVSDSLTAPLKQGIESLLQIAADSVGSHEASVLVRDGNEGGLKFLTAISDVKDKLLEIRIPPGKGIAGLVFSTGQPMAVADVSSDGSFWSEADAKTGFKTITVLATPLRSGVEMVGVLEFVNRPGEPPYPPFTPEEMDRASFYAGAIARIIDALELAQLVESVFDRTIKTPNVPTGRDEDFESNLREWLRSSEAAPEHRDLMLLWVSLREIVVRGNAERELCRDLLELIARFTKRRSIDGSSFPDFSVNF